jgi:tetratricopeptide (TPR) repeat protein
LTRRDPRSAAAWAGAGRLIAGHRQQYARAVEFLERAIALDSTNVSYYTNLGSAQILAGQPRSAVRTLEHALVRFGDTHSLNWALAGAWQKLGDQEKAARYFARAKQLSGSSP